MPECPYCGRWFRSKKGLKIHITKAHTYESVGGIRMLDVSSFDFLGAMERRRKRAMRRRKSLF